MPSPELSFEFRTQLKSSSFAVRSNFLFRILLTFLFPPSEATEPLRLQASNQALLVLRPQAALTLSLAGLEGLQGVNSTGLRTVLEARALLSLV